MAARVDRAAGPPKLDLPTPPRSYVQVPPTKAGWRPSADAVCCCLDKEEKVLGCGCSWKAA